MNKSIEALWKDGFANDIALTAPQINDLYNQKSKNLIDKFETMFAANQKGVLIAAFVVFAVLTFFNEMMLGLFVGLMLAGLVAIGKKQRNSLANINKEQSSFDYLKSFDTWLEKCINEYVKIYRFFYPVLFLVCSFRFLFSEVGTSLVRQYVVSTSETDVQITVGFGLVLAGILMGFFAERIYRADVELYYGEEIRKLKALISDMEALKS